MTVAAPQQLRDVSVATEEFAGLRTEEQLSIFVGSFYTFTISASLRKSFRFSKLPLR
jgi:hypothetical protein